MPNNGLDMSHSGVYDSDSSRLSLPQYAYSPLQHADEIRLLRVTPGTWDDPIRCEIFHCRLSQEISYEPLSYTWGSEEKPSTIDCGENRWLAVTSNCVDAIRRLRKPDRPRTLWIDAVCINQANAFERGHQVRNMPQLYEEAGQVIVYLGEADDDEYQDAFQHLRYYKRLGIEQSRSTALKKLLRRSWFTRVWVLQEVYSAWSLTVICGNMSWPWDPYFVLLRKFLPRVFLDGELPHVLNLRGRDRSDLFDLLIDTGSCACTDPRDRIFALLSMCSDESRQHIEPDYESSTRIVYTRVAAGFLASRGLDDVLGAVDNGPGTDELGLPSWMPDWRICQRCTPIMKLVGPAPNDLPRNVQIHNDNTLDVRGCCVGTIGDLGDVFESNESGWDEACIESWCQLFTRAYPGADNDDLETILHMSSQKSYVFDFFLIETRGYIRFVMHSISSAYSQVGANTANCANTESKAIHTASYEQLMQDIIQALQKRCRRWGFRAPRRNSVRPCMPCDFEIESVWRELQAFQRDKNANRKAALESMAYEDQAHEAIVSFAMAGLTS